MMIALRKIILFVVSYSLLFLLISCAASVSQTGAGNTNIIDSDNPYIQYIGRFDFSNPKSAVFDWAGVYICAKFDGTSCSVRLQDSTDEYAVIVDNRAPTLLTTNGSGVYKIASGLSNSEPHTLMIQKRTEPLVGKGVFQGFILDKGSSLLQPDNRPSRKIEFIGNSITSGYGVMGDSSGCHFSPQTENAAMAYAAISSRELHADYHLISYSGRGVVRNYGDTNKTSPDPMPSLYDRTCCYDSTLKWDFNKWIPQAVVINLGTNDFSTEPYPDKDVFENAYSRLIDLVRSLYPGVTVFCISGPMIGDPCTSYIKEVVKEQQIKKGRNIDVFFIEIPKAIMTENDWGCDMHPNIFGADKMADIIVKTMRLRMNW